MRARFVAGRGRRSESGMTLLELVIAMSILSLVMTGMVATIGSGLTLVRNNRNRSVAANLASQEMDVVRETAPRRSASLAPAVTTQTRGGRAVQGQSRADLGGRTMPRRAPATRRTRRRRCCACMCGSTGPTGAAPCRRPPTRCSHRRSVRYSTSTGHIAVSVLDSDAAAALRHRRDHHGPTAQVATHEQLGLRVLRVPARRHLHGRVERCRLRRPAGSRESRRRPSASPSDRSAPCSSTTTARPRSRRRSRAVNGGVVPTDLPITIANTILLPNGTAPTHRHGHDPHAREPVPGERRLRDVGGIVRRRRPRGHRHVGRRVLPGRDT